MKVEKIINRDGFDIKVVTTIIDPLTGLYRSSAFYKDYPDRVVSIHQDKNKNIAAEVAVTKLINECPPEILDLI
ncbi:hypothetical protein [Bacillus sp. S/N-304-OC-R1]|uniref:hypothetical protein n=1 Tax=Bacillus sp. S/N-304-OC-R1 TaxID=2758034 RepID=UPI001C8DEA3C|nr:hypothetical protein [Bacillus sp. S/N-304-OC-R1]MBY0122168.1 hypothetical protein [Bacillus sp. S/N-304-OC-R1]